MKIFLSLVSLCFVAAVNAQQCDAFWLSLKSRAEKKMLIDREPQPLKEKQLRNEYARLSEQVLRELVNCMEESQPTQESFEALKLNYIYGGLMLDKHNYQEAKQAFEFCLNHPQSKKKHVRDDNKMTYYDFSSKYLKKCIKPQSSQKKESIKTSSIYSEFSTKGGYFMRDLFAYADTSLFDDTALDAEEMEEIAARTLHSGDNIDENLVATLSGSTNFLVYDGFVIMLPDMEGQQSNRSAQSLISYAALLSQYRQHFKSLYFNANLNPDDLFSVYIFEGDASAASLNQYLLATNRIHHRAHRSVAYYQSLDNSIVVWMPSGQGTLIHELVHGLMANDFPDAPLWMNEGMASLYEELDGNNLPANNHRLAYIQQYMLSTKKCLLWTELLDAEMKMGNNETETNVIHAFSRYFCKFVLDYYGQESLSILYKSFREAGIQSPEQQQSLVCSLLNSSTEEIQVNWQNYLLTQRLGNKWASLSDEYADAMTNLPEIPFQTTDMQPFAAEMEKWKFSSKEEGPAMNGPMQQTKSGGQKQVEPKKSGGQ